MVAASRAAAPRRGRPPSSAPASSARAWSRAAARGGGGERWVTLVGGTRGGTAAADSPFPSAGSSLTSYPSKKSRQLGATDEGSRRYRSYMSSTSQALGPNAAAAAASSAMSPHSTGRRP